MAEDEQPKPDRLGDVAADTVIREVVSMAVIAAASWAVMNRDTLARVWARLTARPVTPAQARESRMVADLYRDISRYEHGGA